MWLPMMGASGLSLWMVKGFSSTEGFGRGTVRPEVVMKALVWSMVTWMS